MANGATPKRSDEVLAQRPTGGTANANVRPPIGVPPSYRPTGGILVGAEPLPPGYQGPPTPVFAPRYYEGDDWQPARLSPEEIAEMQRQMEDAGVLRKGTRYRLGVWDDATRAAYRDLLALANASGTTVGDALSRWQQSEALADEDERRLPVRLTHPEDLRSTFETTWRARVGRKPSDAELARMISAYHSAERAEAESAFDVQESGGVMTAAPSPETFATSQARAIAPEQMFAHEVAEQGDEFFDLLKGVGGMSA